MKIAVVGTGYVGLVVGACLAENGSSVICVDKDESKIAALNGGKMTIYEPGLEEMVRRNRNEDRLSFTTDLASAVQASEIIFIAVGTPQEEDGAADLQHVLAVARDVGRTMNSTPSSSTRARCPSARRHESATRSLRRRCSRSAWSATRSF